MFRYGTPVVSLESQLVTTHEIGHNWGAFHDLTDNCTSDPNGKYVMFPTSVDGSMANNNKFSPCSASTMGPTLDAKGQCFVTKPLGICGNKAVEAAAGEQCDDAGPSQCCSSTCKFSSTALCNDSMSSSCAAVCSDANNPCCSNCALNPTKTCFQPIDLDPYCRSTAMCVATVNGTPSCQSPIPSLPTGTPCGDAGRCNGNTNTPYAARCSPFCPRFGADLCTCSNSECELCCRHNPSLPTACGSPFAAYVNGTAYECVSARLAITPPSTGYDSSCYADNPSNAAATQYQLNPKYNLSCVDTADTPCLRMMNRAPGTVCSQGSCDRSGVCNIVSTASAQSWDRNAGNSDSAVSAWMKRNIVGTVIIVVLLVWIPLCWVIHQYDQEQYRRFAALGYKVRYLLFMLTSCKHPLQRRRDIDRTKKDTVRGVARYVKQYGLKAWTTSPKENYAEIALEEQAARNRSRTGRRQNTRPTTQLPIKLTRLPKSTSQSDRIAEQRQRVLLMTGGHLVGESTTSPRESLVIVPVPIDAYPNDESIRSPNNLSTTPPQETVVEMGDVDIHATKPENDSPYSGASGTGTGSMRSSRLAYNARPRVSTSTFTRDEVPMTAPDAVSDALMGLEHSTGSMSMRSSKLTYSARPRVSSQTFSPGYPQQGEAVAVPASQSTRTRMIVMRRSSFVDVPDGASDH